MTTIVIHKSNNQYKGFTCMGHAGYSRKGRPDILCAAISALVLNTVNSLTELAGEELSLVTNEETGFIKCDFAGELKEQSVFLLDAMVFGLTNMSRDYGTKYLQLKFEEV